MAAKTRNSLFPRGDPRPFFLLNRFIVRIGFCNNLFQPFSRGIGLSSIQMWNIIPEGITSYRLNSDGYQISNKHSAMRYLLSHLDAVQSGICCLIVPLLLHHHPFAECQQARQFTKPGVVSIDRKIGPNRRGIVTLFQCLVNQRESFLVLRQGLFILLKGCARYCFGCE